MLLKTFQFLSYFVIFIAAQQQNVIPFVRPDQIVEPTNPPLLIGNNIDIYDPFKTTTRANTPQSDEVLVRINPGQVIGKKINVPNLKWTPDRDWREFRTDKQVDNVNYLPDNVNVSIYTFLGIPYAQKPVGPLRFKVSPICL